MKTIRKLWGICGLFALLMACNKQADEADFSVTLRENFTEITKNKSNIQVDDYIPYELTISDVDNSTGIEYRLVPIREGNSYHQILWKDYGLFLSNTDSVINNKPAYISFSGKGKHTLYIRPLVPGTFKHTYELQKWKGNRQVGDAITIKENFNAVKITIGATIFLEGQFIDVKYYFKIDDGENDTDKYLSSTVGKQKYKMNINININGAGMIEKEFFGDFTEGIRNYFFQPPRNSGVGIGGLREIQIEQYLSDLPTFIIKYENVKYEIAEPITEIKI